MFINYKHKTHALAYRHLKLTVDRVKCASGYISRL